MNTAIFPEFANITITGIHCDSLTDTEKEVLRTAAEYCQAMTDADLDTMRRIVSEDMVFTHMSGRKQSREEYFADIANGNLTYYTIGMEDPLITLHGDTADITYTSVLNARAYGARGVYRMKGTHRYRQINGQWTAVNH